MKKINDFWELDPEVIRIGKEIKFAKIRSTTLATRRTRAYHQYQEAQAEFEKEQRRIEELLKAESAAIEEYRQRQRMIRDGSVSEVVG